MGTAPIVERHFDALWANDILNSESVRGDVADAEEGYIDISAQAANRENVLLCGEHGGFMYFKFMPGMYEVHSFVLPRGRGKWAFLAAKASLDWIFTRTEAYEVTTRIPEGHLAAQGLANKCGLRYEFSEMNGCKWRGIWRAVHIGGIRIQDWITRSPYFEAAGELFHTQLNAEAQRVGVTEAPHATDPTHNRYLGAALAMIEAGLPLKATNFYNRWAVTARHKPVMLVSDNPPEIAMDIGVLRFKGSDFELVRPS